MTDHAPDHSSTMTAVRAAPTTAPVRHYTCPRCGRLLSRSTAETGWALVKCTARACDAWRLLHYDTYRVT